MQPPDPLRPPPEDIPATSPLRYIDSDVNGFRLYRSYLTFPLADPESELSLEDRSDASTMAVAPSKKRSWWAGFGSSAAATARRTNSSIFAPFLNATTFRLMNWFYSGSSMKSLGELDSLVNNVLLADDFDREDLRSFSAARESQRLDDWEDVKDESPFAASDGWHESSVKIRVPAEGVKHVSEEQSPAFEIPGVYHRSITEIIRSTFQSTAAHSFHLIPFKLFAKPSVDPSTSNNLNAESNFDPTESTTAERVYSEMYNSDAMIDEYEQINAKYPLHQANETPTGTAVPVIENVIAAIMLWSDSTHLASFGNAALWPVYLFFGNQSKYVRSRPSEFAAHHLAYLPSVCNISLSDFVPEPDHIHSTFSCLISSKTGTQRYTAMLRPVMF